jgi:aerobic-type carbon monoxide dehydrogenase small subunit (CoxS/CutS family)
MMLQQPKLKIRERRKIVHVSLTTIADRLLLVVMYSGKVIDTIDYFAGEFDQAVTDFFIARTAMRKGFGHEEDVTCHAQ